MRTQWLVKLNENIVFNRREGATFLSSRRQTFLDLNGQISPFPRIPFSYSGTAAAVE